MRLFYHNAVYVCSVLKHIFKVDKVAVMKCVLSKVVSIMEVNNSFIVRLNYIFRKQKSSCDIRACNAGKIITLSCNNSCVFIGVLCVPIFTFAIYKLFNRLVRSVGLANKCTLISIYNINFSKLVVSVLHKFLFNNVLDIFYKNSILL